eukprot:SAG11_NODE_1555_length_4693_cov_10.707009_1_plen_1417_part_10
MEATPKKKAQKKKPATPSSWDNEEPNEVPTRIWDSYSGAGVRTWGEYVPCTWPDGTPGPVWKKGDPVETPFQQYPIDNETKKEVTGKDGKKIGRGATCYLNSDVKTFVDKKMAERQAKRSGFRYPIYCQELQSNEVVNLFIDFDDKAPDEVSAFARQQQIIDWILRVVPEKLPDISADEIGISTNTRIHPSTNVVLQSGEPYEKSKWNTWKVSIHCCINGVKCRLRDQGIFMDEHNWFGDFPVSEHCPKYDRSIYERPHIIRMINSGKPDTRVQEYVLDDDGNKSSIRTFTCQECKEKQTKKGKMPFKCPKNKCTHVWLSIPDRSPKKAHNHSRHLYNHVPTVDLARCITVAPTTPRDDRPAVSAKPPAVKVAKPKVVTSDAPEQSAEEEHDFLYECSPYAVPNAMIFTKYREQHNGLYILELLSHLPANLCYKDWFRVGCFIKHCCRNIFTEPYEVFKKWSALSSAHGWDDQGQPEFNFDEQWDSWGREYQKSFETFRYIVKHTTEEGQDFVEKSTLDNLQTVMYKTPKRKLGPADLARFMVSYQGHDFLGNPSEQAQIKLFELGNGNIWIPRTKTSMSKPIEDVIRFKLLEPCYIEAEKAAKIQAEKEPGDDKPDSKKLVALQARQAMFDKLVLEYSKSVARKNIGQELVDQCCYDKLDELDLTAAFNPFNTCLRILPLGNCVLDFEEYSLRAADPEEMIMYTTGWHWPVDENGVFKMPTKNDIKEVLDFYASITGDDDQFMFFLFTQAICLEGQNRFSEVCILGGAGGNGKGLSMKILAQILGNLMQVLGVEYYQTKAKGGVNQASPEIAKLQFARVVNSAEPDKKKQFVFQQIKILTGGEKLTARQIYEQSKSFMPQFLPIIQTNFDIEIDEQRDAASERRLLVINLPNRFVSDVESAKKKNPEVAHRFRQARADVDKKCTDNPTFRNAALIVLARVWTVLAKDLTDDDTSSFDLPFYPADFSIRREKQLAMSDKIANFLKQKYQITSPTGFHWDETRPNLIPLKFMKNDEWTNNTIALYRIVAVFREQTTDSFDKDTLRGEIREKLIELGAGMAVKDIDTDEGKTITVTNVFGIKQNTSGWMEAPTDGASSENLEHKVYPGPDTTSPDSFYQRILNMKMPSSQKVANRSDTEIAEEDQAVIDAVQMTKTAGVAQKTSKTQRFTPTREDAQRHFFTLVNQFKEKLHPDIWAEEQRIRQQPIHEHLNMVMCDMDYKSNQDVMIDIIDQMEKYTTRTFNSFFGLGSYLSDYERNKGRLTVDGYMAIFNPDINDYQIFFVKRNDEYAPSGVMIYDAENDKIYEDGSRFVADLREKLRIQYETRDEGFDIDLTPSDSKAKDLSQEPFAFLDDENELERNISMTIEDALPSPLTSIKKYDQPFPDSQDSIDDEEQELYDVFQSFSNMFENEGNVVTYQ